MHRGMQGGIASLALLVLTGRAAVCTAEEPPMAEQAKAALRRHGTLSYLLPGNPYFQTAEGIKELGLTEEQKKAIQDIGLVFNGKLLDQRQEAWKNERGDTAKMTEEEKKKFYQKLDDNERKRREQRHQWAIEARQQVEQLLTGKQLEQLREGEFRQRTNNLVYTPQFMDGLGLDNEQKARMKAILEETWKKRQELMQQMTKVEREASGKMVGVLKPEQREKLREALEKLYQQALQVR